MPGMRGEVRKLTMGYGDEIMAAGRAQALSRTGGAPVLIVGNDGTPRWSEVWENIPEIIGPLTGRKDGQILKDGPWCRPYIATWGTWENKPMATFSRWKARDYRATLKLSAAENDRKRQLGEKYGPYIVIEHRKKPSASPNKDLGLDKWQEIAHALGETAQIVQVGRDRRNILDGAAYEPTPRFRDAMAVIAGASLYVGMEGGFHHAAAGFKVPAVVIFGHFINEITTGYPDHANIGSGGHCGRWAPCPDCRRELDSIEPDDVVARANELLDGLEGVHGRVS